MKLINKKARFNYDLLERFEAGIVLQGAEVKALRQSRGDISNAYAKIIEDEIWFINANIPVPGKKNYNSTRTRKLLMHKDQIISLKTKIKAKRLTLVPTKLYNKGNLFKVQLALAKPKKKYQKKEAKKKKDVQREIERALKEHEI